MTTFVATDAPIQRDRWGRPLIEPIDGGKVIAYTRVSTLAKALDDKTALTKWKQRQTVLGIATRPDLIMLAQALSNKKELDNDDKKRLDEVCESAMDASQSDSAANKGTAVHALTEQVDQGVDIDTMPELVRGDLLAYRAAMAGITVLETERFVVVDEVEAAGTFDRLVRLPDGRMVIADVKTGLHEPKYPHGAATQMAMYARGHLYDAKAGRIGHLPSMGVDTSVGLLIHMPVGKGICDLYEMDLNVGWGLAQVSVAVKKAFKGKPIQKYQP